MSKNHLQLVDNQQPAPVHSVGMITPAATIDEALEQFHLYQQLKEKLGSDEDFQPIGGKLHPKKSFVRKVQRFFNVSCEIIQDEPFRDEKGSIIAWLAKARAIHLKTGAFQEADGSCGFDEKVDKYGNPDKKRQTIHNIRAHAITRAKNRAILDLVGFGEVSAEEINEREYEAGYQQSGKQRPQQQQLSPEERRQKGIRSMYAVAKGEKKLSDDEIKALMKAEVKKDSAKDLTLDELRHMYRYFKNHSEQDLKETAKAHMSKPDVIDVDPETGEVDKESFKGRQLSEDEVNKALGLTDEEEANSDSFKDVYDSFEAELRKGFAE